MYTYSPLLREDIAVEKISDLQSSDEYVDIELFRTSKPPRPRPGVFHVCSCTLVALAALIVILVEISRSSWLDTSVVPKFRTEIRTLKAFPGYEQPPNQETIRTWESKIPNSDGTITIENAEALGLLPGLPDHDNATTKYGITWTHEYHCLGMVQLAFWDAIDGISKLYGARESPAVLTPRETRELKHIQHCYDYIRQLILCRADMTVEWAAPNEAKGGALDHIDGYGIPHTCKKQDDVFKWMSGRRPMSPF